MDLVRLLKIAGHLGEDLVLTDAHIDGKTQGVPDLVLDGVGDGHGIGIDPMGAAHVQEALVDGIFLHHRRILPADVHERLGGLLIQPKIRPRQHQIGTLPQGHRHRLAGADPKLLRRNGLRLNHARPLLPIPTDGRGDQPQVSFTGRNPPGSLPAEIGTVHIDMKDESCHGEAPF